VGGGRYVRYGRIGGRRERVRREYRVSSVVKQKKKEENYAAFYFTGKRKIFFYIYDVIVKQKKRKRSTNNYSLSLVTRQGIVSPLYCQ
jgi:hypothetical protein